MHLQAEQLTLAKGSRELLKDVSMQCAAGEMIAICGPNGAGKSTLLRVLSGDERRFQGGVTVNNRMLADYSMAQLARVRAVMPQKVDMPFSFAARDIILMAAPPSVSHADQGRMLAEVGQLFDLGPLLARDYLHLSGGQQQRVQLARVVIQLLQPSLRGKPRFLLLDECTSAMDMAMQQRIFTSLARLKAENIGVVAVMHDLNLASRFADRIMMMHEGRNALCGAAEEVMLPGAIQRIFDLEVTVMQHPRHNCPVLL